MNCPSQANFDSYNSWTTIRTLCAKPVKPFSKNIADIEISEIEETNQDEQTQKNSVIDNHFVLLKINKSKGIDKVHIF